MPRPAIEIPRRWPNPYRGATLRGVARSYSHQRGIVRGVAVPREREDRDNLGPVPYSFRSLPVKISPSSSFFTLAHKVRLFVLISRGGGPGE